MTTLYVSQRDASVRIFASDFLERFTHVHALVPHIIFIPVIAVMLYRSKLEGVGWLAAGLLFALGIGLWSFTEYVVHRFVFHTARQTEAETQEIVGALVPGEPVMPALRSWKQKAYFLAHGVHHHFPNDSKRLVMPPSVSVPLAFFFYFTFRPVAGPQYVWALFAGFVLGYLIYDTTHFAVHHLRMRTKLGRYLKKGHMRHHYLNAHRDYGVSSPVWDVVMHTAGPERTSTRPST